MPDRNDNQPPDFGVFENVIKEFYERAFADPIIGHFFFNKDHTHLIRQQTLFTLNMMGYEGFEYQGKPLKKAHSALPLTNVHFNRRKVLLQEVLAASPVPEATRDRWLTLEEKLRPLIVNSQTNCRH